ncbi:hypothetical protein BgiMline_033016 [Biomphalaria glabrata]|uniref:Uncharacterized protein n=1 Tax=Biomphalaria glabrata TaxID=6526 RepID=A0A2C9LP15_BIOGL|nr:hypothetical protein BgiMline_016007 [Biomphalaria glabrata]
MQQNNPNPYPGFDDSGNYLEPQPAARIRPEAEEFADKHRGCINLFISEKHKHFIPPPPSPRCPTDEARQNYELSRKGHIGNLLGGSGSAGPMEPRPASRVTVESESIADSQKGKEISYLFANYGKSAPSPRPNPRVRQEAEETVEVSRGGRMNLLLHNPKSLPDAPRQAPRVRPEAQENSDLGHGAGMAKIMGRYGETPRSERSVPRVKKEAESIAKLDSGFQMQNLFHNYGKGSLPPQPAAKVKEGKEMAELDRGGRMSRLMQDLDSRLVTESKSTPRGRHNIKRNKATVSEILTESSKWQIVPKPGIRN